MNKFNFLQNCENLQLSFAVYSTVVLCFANVISRISNPWVAQDVVCFASVLDKKMFDKVIVKVSLQCCLVIF